MSANTTLAAAGNNRLDEQATYDPNNLLDSLIEKLHLKNDAALSRALEVAPPVISKIRLKREAKSKKGKTMTVGSIPFYAYIICSLTPRIKQIATDRDFTPMADNEGYFFYHKNSGCYIEILSYDKMLNDAKKRNRAFFDKLQISAT